MNEIKRTNQVLLERLLDISKGKNVSVGRHNELSPSQTTGPRSLNYINKRKEADRIDRENQKIMERIIKQGANYQSRKLEQEYYDNTMRFKKMKQKTMALSVEKMLEKKKVMMKEVRSNYLPLIS
jgi:Hemingway/CFA97